MGDGKVGQPALWSEGNNRHPTMNVPLQKAVSELESHLPELERQRASDTFANDLYEAAYYWCELGRWVLENNTKVNYPERVRGERELLAKLQEILGNKSPEEQLRYGPLLNVGSEILRMVGAVQPPRDGASRFSESRSPMFPIPANRL